MQETKLEFVKKLQNNICLGNFVKSCIFETQAVLMVAATNSCKKVKIREGSLISIKRVGRHKFLTGLEKLDENQQTERYIL